MRYIVLCLCFILVSCSRSTSTSEPGSSQGSNSPKADGALDADALMETWRKAQPGKEYKALYDKYVGKTITVSGVVHDTVVAPRLFGQYPNVTLVRFGKNVELSVWFTSQIDTKKASSARRVVFKGEFSRNNTDDASAYPFLVTGAVLISAE